MGRERQGGLLIIGGHEDKSGSRRILQELVARAGGPGANILIIATAAENQEQTGELYREVFGEMGASCEVLEIHHRREADSSSALKRVADAQAVFFTGGDQLRLTATLGGTGLDEALHAAHAAGLIIAGTSAGASMMSATMIVGGDGDESPKKNTVTMSPGMGFLREVVVDQHFAQRGRINRLLAAVAQNPHILGVGIDEDTAIWVPVGPVFEVLGNQTVTIVDGHSLTHTSVSESSPEQPLTLMDVTLHVLSIGHAFDMRRRRPLSHKAQAGRRD